VVYPPATPPLEVGRDEVEAVVSAWSEEVRRGGSVVPVGLVDADALGRAWVDVASRVCAHLYRVLDFVSGTGRTREPSAKAAQRALSWSVAVRGHDLHARGASMDPESYMVELGTSSISAINLRANLHRFVDALAADYADMMRVRTPVFVLSIVDLKLSGDAEDVIRAVLRSLAHPRLIFLVSAH
jgi:hypothetical protein